MEQRAVSPVGSPASPVPVPGALESRPQRKRTRDIESDQDIDFSALLLNPLILKALHDMGYSKPSPIQLKAIPLGRFGADVIGQAKSGTGKTCVFSVIALEALDLAAAMSSPQVLILEPTREVADQTYQALCDIGKYFKGLVVQRFIGGLALKDDLQALKHKCHIVVGTPGRVAQLIELGALRTSSIRLFILDEADQLLSAGFLPQIEQINEVLPSRKQVLAFSATFTDDMLDCVRKYMRNPQHVLLSPDAPSLEGVRLYYCVVQSQETPWKTYLAKVERLLHILSIVSFHQCLLFTNDKARLVLTENRAVSVAERLTEEGFPARYISGGQAQDERLATMQLFRDFRIRVLVSTDLTSRGIDVDRVNLVINLDIPKDSETLLHRVGRTGRFGTLGIAVSFVTGSELDSLRRICSLYRAPLSPLPDHIPPEFYFYELTTQEEKEAREKLEEERQKALLVPAEQKRDWTKWEEERLAQEQAQKKRKVQAKEGGEDGEIEEIEANEEEEEEEKDECEGEAEEAVDEEAVDDKQVQEYEAEVDEEAEAAEVAEEEEVEKLPDKEEQAEETQRQATPPAATAPQHDADVATQSQFWNYPSFPPHGYPQPYFYPASYCCFPSPPSMPCPLHHPLHVPFPLLFFPPPCPVHTPTVPYYPFPAVPNASVHGQPYYWQ